MKISLGPEDLPSSRSWLQGARGDGECGAVRQAAREEGVAQDGTAQAEEGQGRGQEGGEEGEEGGRHRRAGGRADGDEVVYKTVLEALWTRGSPRCRTRSPTTRTERCAIPLPGVAGRLHHPPAAADKSKWDSEFVAKFGLVHHAGAVVASKAKGKGPKSGVKFMLADAGTSSASCPRR